MQIPQSVYDLIATAPLAHLTTLNPDGSPQVTCVGRNSLETNLSERDSSLYVGSPSARPVRERRNDFPTQ